MEVTTEKPGKPEGTLERFTCRDTPPDESSGTVGQNQVFVRHRSLSCEFGSERVSGASKQANGRASGSALESGF